MLPLLSWGGASASGMEEPSAGSGAPREGAVRGEPAQTDPASSADSLRVLLDDGTVVEMPLEDYVWGAVCAEMPASFHLEALKAQATAARTYALKRKQDAGGHENADVCVRSSCCAAWRSREDALARWGDSGPENAAKLDRAVSATAGQVLTYDGALIDAVFHSSSDGQTADAQEVWGAAAPYLVSVSTPESAETVPNFQSQVTLTAEEFRAVFGAAKPEADLSGDPSAWFTDLRRADWGGVTEVTVGGISTTGAELRSLLGLRSTRFTVSTEDDAVVFAVTAYGHGVGMSQYGANILAQQGWTWQDILAHYYPGTSSSQAPYH